MKDLLLWRALGEREPLADDLVPLLEELASRPPAARAPFAGRLIRAARDERPRVRAAALAGLCHQDGYEALRAIVRGLDDSDLSVALTAVEALRTVGDSDPLRIAHAVFHRDPAIRSQAVTGGLPGGAGLLLPHLLGDDACVGDVVPLLAGLETLPGSVLPAILDRHAAGQLSIEAAAELLRRIKPEDVLERIARGALADEATAARDADSFERVRTLLESLRLGGARPRPPFNPVTNRLPEVIAVLEAATSAHEAAGRPTHAPIDLLVRSLPDVEEPVRRGVALAATARLLTVLPDDPKLIRILVAAWPAAALWRWLDVHARRAAVDDFLKVSAGCAGRQPYKPHHVFGVTWLEDIYESDLVRDTTDGAIDVRALAGVARLVGIEALEKVMEQFRTEDLVAGLRHPRAAPFLTVPGSSDRRVWLVERVRGDERRLWSRHLAHLVPAFNRELLPLLEDFTPAETLELLSLMQRLDPPADFKDPRGRRMRAVADELGRLLVGAPPPADRDGVRMVKAGPQPGAFMLEAGPHVSSGPRAGSRQPDTLGALLNAFVVQWREGPRGPADAFLRIIFLAAIDALSDDAATRRLQALEAESLRYLLFEQFVDDTIPSRLDAALRAALADRDRRPATMLAATLAAAGGIMGGLNRAWSALLGPHAAAPEAAASVAGPPASDIHALTVVDRCRLLDAPVGRILACLLPWVNRRTRGLAECLARRRGPQPRHAEAAAAILLCHDWLPAIDRALAAFLPIVPSKMADRLDADLASRRPGHEPLTLHLHAWLWRWERHLEQGLAILAATDQSLADIVAATRGLTCRAFAVRLLGFVQAVLDRHGFRDMGAFHVHANQRLADATVAALTGPAGPAAAAVFTTWLSRDPDSVFLAHTRPTVVAMLIDLPRDVREVLEPWVSSRGLEDESTVIAAGPSFREEFEACLSRGASSAAHDVDRAVECVLAEPGPSWFMPADWDRLVATGIDDRTLARRLAVARQPHAYSIALETLLTEPVPTTEDVLAIAAFLEQGDSRLAVLRLEAARLLLDRGDPVGLPLLLADESAEEPRTPQLFAGLDAAAVADAVRSALATRGVRESVLSSLLLEPAVTADARAEGLRILLAEGTSDTVRDRILPHLARSRGATDRIHRVAESFAWGIRRGLELTGKLFSVEMIAGEGLGYTRLNEPRVFVNPLPLLRGERHGEDVVRGLVIHEVGHHVYHADTETRQAAARAHEEGIFPLLNLVEDEHLERNLRAIDPAMGDPLKRLAAYAFQHAPRELAVPKLLELLDDQVFAVLAQVRLGVARQAGHVVVQSGRLLRHLESRGSAFSRFVRALRMGLGGRGADARTAEALALFGPGFRHASGARLLEIARELQRIFGDETRLLELLGDLGTPVAAAPGDPVRVGEGVTDREIQQEVERVLAPPSTTAGRTGPTPAGARLQINVSPEEEFDRISTVEPVPFDPARSAEYRRRVARPAAQLRPFFERLGFAHQLERQRLQGRLLDRGRLLALAIRGEPRVMVSRRLVPSTDLFLGVAVDCSGSMGDDGNIEKARLFAELLAESVRGLRGIDFRVCGFTDSTILDAGSAARCAAHNLDVGGGNNDAAGLWHLAGEAIASRRRAKLLVMISDGLPTECSVAALRKLVQVLSHRHGMCCAQVAVRPLEEECFPIHVRLEHEDPGRAVAAFGKTVVRLVQRAVGTRG